MSDKRENILNGIKTGQKFFFTGLWSMCAILWSRNIKKTSPKDFQRRIKKSLEKRKRLQDKCAGNKREEKSWIRRKT